MRILLILFIFFFSYTTYSQTAEEYFNSGLEKMKNRDFSNAIEDYNKAIELDPNNGKIYYNRGFPKGMLEDYEGSCEDFNKALELGMKFKKKDKKFIFKYCEIGD